MSVFKVLRSLCNIHLLKYQVKFVLHMTVQVLINLTIFYSWFVTDHLFIKSFSVDEESIEVHVSLSLLSPAGLYRLSFMWFSCWRPIIDHVAMISRCLHAVNIWQAGKMIQRTFALTPRWAACRQHDRLYGQALLQWQQHTNQYLMSDSHSIRRCVDTDAI